MGSVASDLCLSRESKVPRRIAELTSEEAYMLKRQQDLKLYIYSCKDLERAFLSHLHFNLITEKELCGILVSLKLLREDSPSDTLLW